MTFINASVKNQAYKVLGAVDFLGNPLGLAHDIKDGLEGVLEGNFSSVIQGFPHPTALIFTINFSRHNERSR